MSEFDYQWKHIPSKNLEYNQARVKEFLDLTKINSRKFIRGKDCLDAGCGSGRYTYAMRILGASRVESFDISHEAVIKCRTVNHHAFVFDIMDLAIRHCFDFVFCWGVLHHLQDPRKAFSKLAQQVKQGGILHIMVYHQDTQERYQEARKAWHDWPLKQQLEFCEEKVRIYGGDLHGWFDAFNPKFNWAFTEKEVKQWFEEEGFSKIKTTKKYNINMRGRFDGIYK